jgi:hypothetical protein
MRKGRIIQSGDKYQITSFKTGKALSKKYATLEGAESAWVKMRQDHLSEEEE